MCKEKIILGIDTSNYTTSVAWVTEQGEVLAQERQLLKVKTGGRGLRQSEAVFQHSINLPQIIKRGQTYFDKHQLVAVAASVSPRPQRNSYMPVFKVSEGYGQALASVLQVPFFPTTHQEGHIMAGIYSAGGPQEDEFLAVHLSGGTTDLLRIRRQEITQREFLQIEMLGTGTDLHAGQFVDRVGVALGLPFPAGPHLENLAKEAEGLNQHLPSAVEGFNISFSGPESQALRWIERGVQPKEVARAVEHCIATALEKVLRKAVTESNLQQVLIVGGVAANTYLRQRLRHRLEHRAVGAQLYFADPQYSADNAAGVGLIGSLKFKALAKKF